MISSAKVNDKRKIEKFSNYILYKQREMWSNWWYTSILKSHAHNSAVEDRRRDISITTKVQCLGGSLHSHNKKREKRRDPALKFWHKKVGRKTDLYNLYDWVKAPLTSNVYYYNHLPPLPHSLQSHSPSLTPPWVITLCLPALPQYW